MSHRIYRVLSLVLVFAAMLAAFAAPASAMESVFYHSDSYASSEYYQKLTEVQLTGDPRVDIVNIALSQLGYEEGGMQGEYGGSGRSWHTRASCSPTDIILPEKPFLRLSFKNALATASSALEGDFALSL